jgi:hypothetical protein
MFRPFIFLQKIGTEEANWGALFSDKKSVKGIVWILDPAPLVL